MPPLVLYCTHPLSLCRSNAQHADLLSLRNQAGSVCCTFVPFFWWMEDGALFFWWNLRKVGYMFIKQIVRMTMSLWLLCAVACTCGSLMFKQECKGLSSR